MDAATARATLHHWIDQADDAFVIGLVALSAQFKAALEQKHEQHLLARGLLPTADPPQTSGEWWANAHQRREEADRQGRAASAARMRQSAEERAGKGHAPIFLNSEGQRTDGQGNALPPEDA
jgi:hypothetical protein